MDEDNLFVWFTYHGQIRQGMMMTTTTTMMKMLIMSAAEKMGGFPPRK